MKKLKECPKCGGNKFKEVIDEGIKQETTYEDGHITEERTTYETDKGKVECLNPDCDFETEEDYEL